MITRYACPLCDWILEVPAAAIASGEIVDTLSPDDIAVELRSHGLSHTAAALLSGGSDQAGTDQARTDQARTDQAGTG